MAEETQKAVAWAAVAGEVRALAEENIAWFKELRASMPEEGEGASGGRIEAIVRLLEVLGEGPQLAGKTEPTDRQREIAQSVVDEAKCRASKFRYRFGGLLEYMVVPHLIEKFGEMGFAFTLTSGVYVNDKERGLYTWADPVFQNETVVMAVDIVPEPDINGIKSFAGRLAKLQCAELVNKKRMYLGAVAGEVFHEKKRSYALKSGFYVIEPSGDTVAITAPVNPVVLTGDE